MILNQKESGKIYPYMYRTCTFTCMIGKKPITFCNIILFKQCICKCLHYHCICMLHLLYFRIMKCIFFLSYKPCTLYMYMSIYMYSIILYRKLKHIYMYMYLCIAEMYIYNIIYVRVHVHVYNMHACTFACAWSIVHVECWAFRHLLTCSIV